MSGELRRLTEDELKSPAQILIAELEAANARLRDELETARVALQALSPRPDDGYKALAELRGEALKVELARHVREGHWNEVTQPKPDTCSRCKDLTAAIAATPDEVREKARR